MLKTLKLLTPGGLQHCPQPFLATAHSITIHAVCGRVGFVAMVGTGLMGVVGAQGHRCPHPTALVRSAGPADMSEDIALGHSLGGALIVFWKLRSRGSSRRDPRHARDGRGGHRSRVDSQRDSLNVLVS